MIIGDTVRITKPDGTEHLFPVETKQDLAYYERFPIGDFTLDVLSKVTIHSFADSSCVSCEG